MESSRAQLCQDLNKLNMVDGEEGEQGTEKKDSLIVLENGMPIFQTSAWPKLKTLTHIDLSKCNIGELPDALGDIAALCSLQVSHNALTSLPSSIGQLKSLIKLVAPFNKLSNFPSSFSELNALEHLDVSHNEFSAPPGCLEAGCIKISYLDISHNKIEEWNMGPLCAYGLKYFNCAQNVLKTNPSWLWGDFCHSLEDLDLSFNFLTNPAFMVKTYTLWRTGVTVGLKHLNLSNCGLNSNHLHLIHQLKAVQKLQLGNTKRKAEEQICHTKQINRGKDNFLWHFTFKPFQSKTVLTELYLCRVGFAALPDDIDCLETLQILDCEGNVLQWLPDTFSKLFNLNTAIFSNNKLLYLPEDVGNMRSLKELWLDNNQIGELPPSFSNLQNLKWLDLYCNNLEAFPPSVQALLPQLSGLDLEYNGFDSQHALNEKANSSNLYHSLKEAMRKHPQTGVQREAHRNNGMQLPSENYDNEDSDSCKSRHFGLDSNSDCGSTKSQYETENFGETPSEEEAQDEENWDLDEGQDDYFDPTSIIPEKTQFFMPARALIINELVLRPDSFCPSDIHPSPAIRPSKDPFAPDEGQFDDA